MLKVAKFGGSSLAGAEQFKKVKAIVEADPARMCVVVSAAGKRYKKDNKITDLLYLTHAHINYGVSYEDIFSMIEERYYGIRDELGLKCDLESEFQKLRGQLNQDISVDYLVSRGEYLTAKLMSEYLGYAFLDAADCVVFSYDGQIDYEKTYANIAARAEMAPRFVMPGFYGALPNGRIKVMTRGGSDITGAIVANALDADIYENWTDVSGLFSCDPRIVDNPAPIDVISYAELRELAYMGASVLHESAIFPVKAAGIPVNIRNTNDPDAPGTMIQTNPKERGGRTITGIAGRGCYTSIMIEKDQMNEEVGFAIRVLQVLAKHNIIVEHIPTGIDIMSVIVPGDQLAPHRDEVMAELWAETRADSIRLNENMALLTVVGQGMKNQLGAAGRVFGALGRAGINVNMIDQGSDELNLIIGIDAEDLNPAIRALYHEFFG